MSEGRTIGTVLDLFLIMDMTYVLCRRQLSASQFGMTYTSDRRNRTSRRIYRQTREERYSKVRGRRDGTDSRQ